jgi:hypothetical protein
VSAWPPPLPQRPVLRNPGSWYGAGRCCGRARGVGQRKRAPEERAGEPGLIPLRVPRDLPVVKPFRGNPPPAFHRGKPNCPPNG